MASPAEIPEFGTYPITVVLSEEQRKALDGVISAEIEQFGNITNLERLIVELEAQTEVVGRTWGFNRDPQASPPEIPQAYKDVISSANNLRVHNGSVLNVSDFYLPLEADIRSRDSRLDIPALHLGELGVSAIHLESSKILAAAWIDTDEDEPWGSLGFAIDPAQSIQHTEAWLVQDLGSAALLAQFLQGLSEEAEL